MIVKIAADCSILIQKIAIQYRQLSINCSINCPAVDLIKIFSITITNSIVMALHTHISTW